MEYTIYYRGEEKITGYVCFKIDKRDTTLVAMVKSHDAVWKPRGRCRSHLQAVNEIKALGDCVEAGNPSAQTLLLGYKRKCALCHLMETARTEERQRKHKDAFQRLCAEQDCLIKKELDL